MSDEKRFRNPKLSVIQTSEIAINEKHWAQKSIADKRQLNFHSKSIQISFNAFLMYFIIL